MDTRAQATILAAAKGIISVFGGAKLWLLANGKESSLTGSRPSPDFSSREPRSNYLRAGA